MGLVDNPLKISWLEGRPQGMKDPRHPELSQVKSQALLSWIYSGFGGPFPIWALLRALSSQIQVIRSGERLSGLPARAGGLGFRADPFPSECQQALPHTECLDLTSLPRPGLLLETFITQRGFSGLQAASL